MTSDRHVLVDTADRYLDALVAPETGRLPLAPSVRFTENGQTLPLGAGLWRTARGRLPGGQYFADPEAGEVAFRGAVDEMGTPAILALRLRVERGLVSEVESLVLRQAAFPRQGAFLFDPAGPRPPRSCTTAWTRRTGPLAKTSSAPPTGTSTAWSRTTAT